LRWSGWSANETAHEVIDPSRDSVPCRLAYFGDVTAFDTHLHSARPMSQLALQQHESGDFSGAELPPSETM
jgi:hypothetical protein